MNALTPIKAGEIMEAVVARGDLALLSPQERAKYYVRVCESIGLNPMTRPFAYITLNGKLTLYALKDCTEQLRTMHAISVTDLLESERDGVFIVTAKVKNAHGRTDAAKGAVTIKGLQGEALANALMKTETKAKRRATLSICGLGFLDETEVEDIPDKVTHREPLEPPTPPEPPADPVTADELADVEREFPLEAYTQFTPDPLQPPDPVMGKTPGTDALGGKPDVDAIPPGLRRAKKATAPDAAQKAAEPKFDADQWLKDLDGALSGCTTAAQVFEVQETVQKPAVGLVSSDDYYKGRKLVVAALTSVAEEG